MTQSSTDVELPRFSRQIGITGLAEFGEQSDERPPIGVLRPFAGVLDTPVQQKRSRHALPQLAYLTLAPLVTRELSTTDERDEQAGGTGTDTRASAGEGPTEADEGAEEPRVRDVLQDELRKRTANEQTTAGEVREDADRGGSELTTLEPITRDAQNEPPDAGSGGSSPADRIGWRSEDIEGDRLDVTEPPKTVVDRSDSDLDQRSALDAGDIGRDVTVPSEGWLAPDTGEGSVPASQSGTATPTMTLLDEHGVGRGGTRNDVGDSSSVVGDVGPDSRGAARGGAGPDLTVGRTGQSAQTPRTTAPGDRDVAGSAPSGAGRRTEPSGIGRRAGTPPESGGSSAERTVIAEDGSVNHRVLDRLYQELTRKRQIERSREGR